jgi:TRAP-type mannitol/chloroaromatic compound transport system substrate-binding protein
MEEVGASVTVLPGGELYQALEKGVLDGTEFSLPTVDEQLGFYKVAKFYHLPGWHQPSTSQYLYVNLDAWNGLSDQQKVILETACMAGVTHAIAKAEALQGPVLTKFTEEHGVTAVRIPDEVLRALQDATVKVLAREAEKDAMFKKVLDSQVAFQKQHKPWKELGYLPRDWPLEPTKD